MTALKYIAICTVFTISFLGLAHLVITYPSVYLTYPEKKCVEVISIDPLHTCENLPERYYSIHVSSLYKSKS